MRILDSILNQNPVSLAMGVEHIRLLRAVNVAPISTVDVDAYSAPSCRFWHSVNPTDILMVRIAFFEGSIVSKSHLYSIFIHEYMWCLSF
jgi:hypothetical protein